jgi:hypothetical protein
MSAEEERTAELKQILRDALTLPLSQEEVRMLCCALAIDSKEIIGCAHLYGEPPQEGWFSFMHDDSPF